MRPIRFQEARTKLGRIKTWNLPPVRTCPGATSECLQVCYARKGRQAMPSKVEAYERNYGRYLKDPVAWVGDMVKSLKGVKYFRIHSAGDFFSISYIHDWMEVVRLCPLTTFMAYTRSWRVGHLKESLEGFRRLPNVRLYASIDQSTLDPQPEGWYRAYMLPKESVPYWPKLWCLHQKAGIKCDECLRCWQGHDVVFAIH